MIIFELTKKKKRQKFFYRFLPPLIVTALRHADMILRRIPFCAETRSPAGATLY
jgi:hypothetical protein